MALLFKNLFKMFKQFPMKVFDFIGTCLSEKLNFKNQKSNF